MTKIPFLTSLEDNLFFSYVNNRFGEYLVEDDGSDICFDGETLAMNDISATLFTVRIVYSLK